MNISELKIGDILLFSPEKGSFISWAITFLTDAPVSHAAMFYNADNQSIVEETPPQVAVNPAEQRFKGREIYVRRLDDKDLPLSPVVACATRYLNDNEPYANSALYMVGLLLIYKKFTPGTLVQKAMIKILKKLTASIVKYIDEHRNPGKLPMVCSQFVAQCYDDAGDKYRLKIENGVLRLMATGHTGGNVLDQVMESVKSGKKKELRTFLVPGIKDQEELPSGEDLCRELKDAIESKAVEMPAGISDDLVEAVSQFSHAHYLLSTGDVQFQGATEGRTLTALQYLKDNENIYVFPGDLLEHCTNVKDVGTIKL